MVAGICEPSQREESRMPRAAGWTVEMVTNVGKTCSIRGLGGMGVLDS